jgi:glycosyltransferase involved in cell wall biosynthesis
MARQKDKKLSIVIITRNEESNISQCIESAMMDSKGISTEIVLVDSESTDRTVEIARRYPVKIINASLNKYKSPSAGRYIGTRESNGEFILFLDADVRLINGWIRTALSYLNEHDLAGVRGRLFNVYPGEKINRSHGEKWKVGYGKPLGGQASIYRRSALEESGTFHPFLRGEEERELFYRLDAKGWKVRVVDVPMAYHFHKTKDESEIDEKAGYYTGVGQIARKYPFGKITRNLIKSQMKVLLEISAMILLIASLIYLSILGYFNAVTIIVASIMICMLFVSINRGSYKLYLYIRSRILIAKNIIIGLVRGLDDQGDFMKKIRIRIIKKGNMK